MKRRPLVFDDTGTGSTDEKEAERMNDHSEVNEETAAAAATSNHPNQPRNTTRLWDIGEPPPPPDPPDMVIHDISCQGTIAMALQEALDEFQQQQEQEEQLYCIDNDQVMRAFGESIVQQQQNQYDSQCDIIAMHHYHRHQNNNNNNSNCTIAPAATVRGRIKHYNRYGTKWRIVIENAEIIPQQYSIDNSLQQPQPQRNHRNQHAHRRNITRSNLSLSQRSDHNNTMSLQHTTNSSIDTATSSIKIPQLELLLYNDIE